MQQTYSVKHVIKAGIKYQIINLNKQSCKKRDAIHDGNSNCIECYISF